MLILLSPSKTQVQMEYTGDFSLPNHLEKVEKLVNELRQLTTDELAKLMAISEKLAISTEKRLHEFTFPPTTERATQALVAFRGDVYSEMEVDSYTPDDFSFAQNHLRILSGLYGVLRPLDLIQPYRLEIGGKFRPENHRNLYQFWRDDITNGVNETLGGLENPILINLASVEYFKGVDKKQLRCPVVSVFFKQIKGGKFRTVAIHAKKGRGSMANYIIRNRILDPAQLRDFTYGGYIYNDDASTENELVYLQSQD